MAAVALQLPWNGTAASVSPGCALPAAPLQALPHPLRNRTGHALTRSRKEGSEPRANSPNLAEPWLAVVNLLPHLPVLPAHTLPKARLAGSVHRLKAYFLTSVVFKSPVNLLGIPGAVWTGQFSKEKLRVGLAGRAKRCPGWGRKVLELRGGQAGEGDEV